MANCSLVPRPRRAPPLKEAGSGHETRLIGYIIVGGIYKGVIRMYIIYRRF